MFFKKSISKKIIIFFDIQLKLENELKNTSWFNKKNLPQCNPFDNFFNWIFNFFLFFFFFDWRGSSLLNISKVKPYLIQQSRARALLELASWASLEPSNLKQGSSLPQLVARASPDSVRHKLTTSQGRRKRKRIIKKYLKK